MHSNGPQEQVYHMQLFYVQFFPPFLFERPND